MWNRVRGLLLVLLLLVVAGIAMAALRSGDHHGRLDPRSVDRNGSRAVAELLKNRGVTTRVVTTLEDATSAAGADTTVLVTEPDMLTAAQQQTFRSATASAGGRTVLMAAGPASVGTLAPGVDIGSRTEVSERSPRCDLPAARRAGSADLGGERYVTEAPGADRCYPSGGLPSLVRLDAPNGGDTVLLGAPDILYNDRLDKHGNASLALQLLGSHPELVWYIPSLDDPSAALPTDGDGDDQGSGESDGEDAFLDLIPGGWLWGSLQLLVAAVLAAVWRARRLGPLVTEQLPVAIRASETTEGRARLYRKVNARDRAAASLRSATRTRLAPLLGVSAADTHSPEVLLPAVSAHLPDGEHDLRELLFGAPPADDTALVRLADQLDALEREVRTS
ncbi:secreted protein [Streptomyces pristinaespiralis ATCC 25486]|uniref:Secreted protein n=1 Tax=Streptomyces pristinaespiralis (strain ATCC 25486 / DSM 40338 / CBS 914.69 / JCM 4507 / KCC S-0507 / NBRC 13074 / NRRL 2958 / 5647) TaxID=457429 RepID=B5HI41_STRE2|nr:secreted protein [Streptomyces pristinaespiralis ATCC 25486]